MLHFYKTLEMALPVPGIDWRCYLFSQMSIAVQLEKNELSEPAY
jgi:hypothetical protein